MASTVIKSTASASGVAFGVAPTISNALIESFTHTKNSEKATTSDADGDIVSAAYYGFTESINVSGKTNGSITATFGTAITMSGTAPTGSFYPDSYEESQSNNGYKSFTLTATRYAGTES